MTQTQTKLNTLFNVVLLGTFFSIGLFCATTVENLAAAKKPSAASEKNVPCCRGLTCP